MPNDTTVTASDTTPVSYIRHTRVGVIRIDNPPVNALGQAVRQGLVDALQKALADDAAEAVVVLAAGRTFIAGADIREFGKPPQGPLLPDVIAALEASTKPLIAVLHGTALGGGLEVALGCHLRIALEGTRVGLPEVKLGLLPGAGGTQRLPRLAGIERALDMITRGHFVDADEARRYGIVDDVVAADEPLTMGLAAAERLLAGHYTPRTTGELPAPTADGDALQRYRAQLARDVPYLFSPFRCVDAVEAATRLPFADGLTRERALFSQCMDSPQRAGMIHAFFAARGTHKVPEADPEATFATLALVGDHALFTALAAPAVKAGIRLAVLDSADGEDIKDVEACLVAPDADDHQCRMVRNALPAGTPWVDVTTPQGTPATQPGDASLVFSPRDPSQPICELVDCIGDPALTQTLANTLRRLKQQVVVTRDASVIAALDTALRRALGVTPDVQAAAWRTEGWDLSPWLAGETAETRTDEPSAENRRPLDLAWQQAAEAISQAGQVHRDGDIDVLAIHAFGFPAHLGGPRFRGRAA
ncbi:enoyl-CoA hydratase/isomerase family protein [Halomonas borealis]|uniref:enoyl-CoA hydratase/isomerase family protein n=1 Tax=Halomonas borealis TaxID=2508710 RepID=UPI0010A0927D|nr:enoyl-CoA hydratase/isomerase family protein [Halomonas borealis]